MPDSEDVVVVELDGICNYLPIGNGIVTAGQPSEEHLRQLASGGFQAVVNLGLLDPKYCLPNEAASVAALGMSNHHIPVIFQNPLDNGILPNRTTGPTRIGFAPSARVSSIYLTR
jgi:hypothetical protein